MFAQSRKIGKPNILKVFGRNKPKRPKQDSQSRLGLPMPQNGGPYFFIIITLFRICSFKKNISVSKTGDSIEIAFNAVESILMKYFVYIHVVFVQAL